MYSRKLQLFHWSSCISGLLVMSMPVLAVHVWTCYLRLSSTVTMLRTTLYGLCWVTSTSMHWSSSWLQRMSSTWQLGTDWWMACDHLPITSNVVLTSLRLWQQKLPTRRTIPFRFVDDNISLVKYLDAWLHLYIYLCQAGYVSFLCIFLYLQQVRLLIKWRMNFREVCLMDSGRFCWLWSGSGSRKLLHCLTLLNGTIPVHM